MDESGIEATQALDLSDFDDVDYEESEKIQIGNLNVRCQKGFPGKLFPVFEGDNIVGRHEDCAICIPLKGLSREHACIEVKGDAHYIYDKGSKNKTRRNKHFLAASVRYELKDKDSLTFGDVECTYQVGKQAVDDDETDSETGSESMFQTAPVDEDEACSDASSDVLQPTQPFSTNTQSSLVGKGTFMKKSIKESTLNKAHDITVKDTPAPGRTKRFIDDLVLPESDSDTDDGTSIAGATLAAEDLDESVKARLMGAATQAYVPDSDASTDDEDSMTVGKSILMAPTQAFVDEDASEADSPRKRSILMAATQAYAPDSDSDDTISPGKAVKPAGIEPTMKYSLDQGIEPTVAYDMGGKDQAIEPTMAYDMGGKDHVIEPTVAYDMDEEDEESDNKPGEKAATSMMAEPTQAFLGEDEDPEEEEEEEKVEKSRKIMAEPTQAFAGVEEDDGKSDTSEEFVLEGDTDNEGDNEDLGNLLAAPTLAMDDVCDEGADSTKANSGEEATQVMDESDDPTLAVAEEATQVFNDSSGSKPSPKRKRPIHSETDETQVLGDDATQVFNDSTGSDPSPKRKGLRNSGTDDTQVVGDDATQVVSADATQVFDDNSTQVFDSPKQDKKTKAEAAETQVFETQVFDEEDSPKKPANRNMAETQVFADDATQVIDDFSDSKEKKSKHLETDSTQVFTDNTQVFEDEAAQVPEEETVRAKKVKDLKKVPKAEAVLGVSNNDATQAFVDADNEEMFDVNAAATLDVMDTADINHTEEMESHPDDATQVIDEVLPDKTTVDEPEATVAVCEATVPVVETTTVTNKSRKRVKTPTKAGAAVLNANDATQVFENEETSTGTNKSRKRVKTPTKAGAAVHGTDDATQVFENEETSTVTNKSRKRVKTPTKAGASVLSTDDATQVFEDAETLAVEDDATQAVVSEVDSTVNISDVLNVEHKTKGSRKTKGLKEEKEKCTTVKAAEKATEAFDVAETVAIEETMKISEVDDNVTESKPNKKDRSKRKVGSVGIETEDEPKLKRKGKATETSKNVTDSEAATQVFATEDSGEDKKEKDKPSVLDEKLVEIPDASVKRISRSRSKKKGSNEETDLGNTKLPTKTDVKVSATNNQSATTRGSRTRGKKGAEIEAADDTLNSGKKSKRSTRGKEEKLEEDSTKMEQTVDVHKGRGGRKGKPVESPTKARKEEESVVNQKAGPSSRDVEPETQLYGHESEPETQIYDGDVTPPLEGDVTPPIDEVLAGMHDSPDEEEEETGLPKPKPVRIPSRSPYKSALSSPEKKKKSPSPKRVQFVSLEAESYDQPTTTRPKRGKKSVTTEEQKKPTGKKKGKMATTSTDETVKDSNSSDIVPATIGRRKGRHATETESLPQKTEINVETSDNHTRSKGKAARGKTKQSITETESSVDPKTKCEETNKETTGPRSKSRTTGRRVAEPTSEEMEKSVMDKTPETQSKPLSRGRATRGKITDSSTTEEKKGVKPKNEQKQETETVMEPVSKGRVTRGKVVDSGTADNKETANKGPSRRGRQSVDTEVAGASKAPASAGSKMRSSLPAVLDDKLASSDPSKDSEHIEKEEEQSDKTGKGRKKGRSAVRKIPDVESVETETVDTETVTDKSGLTGRTTRTKKGSKQESKTKADTQLVSEQKTENNEDSASKATSDSIGKKVKGSKNVTEAKAEAADATSDSISKKVKGSKNVTEAKAEASEVTSDSIGKKVKGSKNVTEAKAEAAETSVVKKGRTRTRGGGDSKEESNAEEASVKQEVKEESEAKSGLDKGKRVVRSKVKHSDDKQEEKDVKTLKEDKPDKPKQSLRGKRGAAETNPEESTEMETPAKRMKVGAVEPVSTPRSANKQPATANTPASAAKRQSNVSTPRGANKPDLDTSVTGSPLLRKTSVEGVKAKVMFTGVMDEQGEKVVKELGGELVGSVYDCTHLVTDQIRRTVKFLCCLSRGVPIVTRQWLVSSKRSGFFSDPTPFLVRDDASEKKHKFTLQTSLCKASDGRLLDGYKIHVTKSVKPDPGQMKDIVQCAGAQYLTAMPRAAANGTVVISCTEDQGVCEGAVKAGVTVVSPEFILTGVLRQEADTNPYLLFTSSNKRSATTAAAVEPAAKKRKR